jgi:hypothetical protein
MPLEDLTAPRFESREREVEVFSSPLCEWVVSILGPGKRVGEKKPRVSFFPDVHRTPSNQCCEGACEP